MRARSGAREKENRKLAEASLPRLRAIDAFAWLEKACGMGKVTFMCDKPSEKLVEAFKFQVVDREGRKEVALPPLGTSKINSS